MTTKVKDLMAELEKSVAAARAHRRALPRRRLFFRSDVMDASEREDGWYHDNDDLLPVEHEQDANLMSSLCDDGQHMPVIDIDIPGAIELVPSTTEGHTHLLINVPISEAQLMDLLELLSEIGLVEEGYWLASQARGQSLVRTPWSPKVKHEVEG